MFLYLNAVADGVTTVSVTESRKHIRALIDSIMDEGGILRITSKKGNAVLISEKDWNAVKETLYLLSVPDMLGSIEEAESMNISECAEWDSLKDIL